MSVSDMPEFDWERRRWTEIEIGRDMSRATTIAPMGCGLFYEMFCLSEDKDKNDRIIILNFETEDNSCNSLDVGDWRSDDFFRM
jgi:hypothetical protein